MELLCTLALILQLQGNQIRTIKSAIETSIDYRTIAWLYI
jgi:hypothetical protein